MKKTLLLAVAVCLILYFTGLTSDFIQLFKNNQGRTNWQYVANWSSGILIILLSITAVVLFLSRLAKQKANNELEAIKSDLEIRVKERTATLAESNQQLKSTTDKLHASEHYIASILKSMPSMLVGLNIEGVITQWNNKAEQYTGICADKAIGQNLWEVYPIITITRNQVKLALAQKTPTTIRQSQRGLFHFDITIFPLQESGESGVVLLLDDVSKQVKSENKLIQKDRISSMGELASTMAHDMNIPLQSMLSDIKKIEARMTLLSKDDGHDIINDITDITANLTGALTQGQQASAIVDNLLNFSSSQQKIQRSEAIEKIMDHSIDLAKSVLSLPKNLSFNDVTIQREYDEKLPQVNCHSLEIQQVFLSLLRHCFHALSESKSEDFTPTINIRILECYDALWLKISHNGVGLSSEEQQSIFEPFFSNQPLDSEDDADKRLSFSHFVITEQHDGQMAVTSDVRVGTTFHIHFQLK